MNTRNRPLSPHLQVYRLPLAAVMSISHRATGVLLTVGTLMLAYWLGAAAYGPDAFARAQAFVGSWFGILLLLGWSACLFYHLCNGVRHLLWDAGWGFELPQTFRANYVVLACAAGLTVLCWIAGFAAWRI
ncbi:MAG: succinate dehydrogenase, cytochrome b556 subunit [Rhodospirillales bacterium]|nr:succinate dehydrogenase, cytochrome b556 subunit [Rhodospirillales bacterium]